MAADFDYEKLESIFMNYSFLKKKEFSDKKLRFVHYTSAENAIKIIQNKEFWLRNAKCMNDYNEISHGYSMLIRYFNDLPTNHNRPRFIKSFDNVDQGMAKRVFSRFDEWWNRVHYNTFIGSISEHSENENEHGRLSMWRAYGKNSAKAALIFNIPINDNAIDLDNVFLVPVAYLDDTSFMSLLSVMISNVDSNLDFLKTLPVDEVENMLFLSLVMLAVTLKHKGFSEEKEWRVVYLPLLFSNDLIKESIEVVAGVPQKVCKIKLEDQLGREGAGLVIDKLVSEILIGPSDYPSTIFDAFSHVLAECGVEESWNRVKISNIPLRSN